MCIFSKGLFFSNSSPSVQESNPSSNSTHNLKSENIFGYRDTHLYQRRITGNNKERIFQLIADYQYQQRYSALSSQVANKNIVLLCQKAGGNGDVAQTFLCAELIKQEFPDCHIKIVIECPFNDHKDVEKIFPMDQFEVQFLSGDFHKKVDELKKIRNEAQCLLGIAVPVSSFELRGPQYRTFREYGYVKHPDIKEQHLAMGLNIYEEGINFPIKKQHRLQDLKTQWLKEVLDINENGYPKNRKLYHIYVPAHVWTIQMIALYSIAGIEKQSANTIDIFFPLKYSLKDLLEWKMLQLEELKNNGIGKLILVTETTKETIELGEGKTLQIVSNFNTFKADMETIEQHSEPFFTCTGNMSLSAGFILNKFMLYANMGPDQITKDWSNEVSKLLNSKNLAAFHDLLNSFSKKEADIFQQIKPKKISFYQDEPPIELTNPNSISRKSIPLLTQSVLEVANKIIQLYLHTSILQESEKFNNYIVENFDVKPRLFQSVARGLLLNNFPNLIEVEATLSKQFQEGMITEEEVAITLDLELNNMHSLNNFKFAEESRLSLNYF